MKVLIYEFSHTGHRYEYLRRVIPVIKELDVDVVLACPVHGFQSEQYRIHLSGIESLFRKRECPAIRISSSFATQWKTTTQFCHSVQAEAPDHVYLPVADGISQAMAFRRLVQPRLPFTEALHFRGSYGYPLRSLAQRLRRFADGICTAAAPWSVYAHVDPWQLAAFCRQYPQISSRSLLMPDPVDPATPISKLEARTRLEVPVDGRYVGCAGPMNHRKGIDLLVAAFQSALPRLPADTRLLLAGPFEPSIRAFVHSQASDLVQRGNLVLIDRHLTDTEMGVVIPAMDVVCTPYRDHAGSSGIALRAIANERPLLAPNRYWLGKVVTTFDVGRTCNVLSHDAFVDALIQSLAMAETYRLTASAKRFLQFQSPENFTATWTLHLRRRLGLAPSPSIMDWNAVLDSAREPTF